jgi:hypothetical protein
MGSAAFFESVYQTDLKLSIGDDIDLFSLVHLAVHSHPARRLEFNFAKADRQVKKESQFGLLSALKSLRTSVIPSI